MTRAPVIRTLLQIAWIELRRDRVALFLTFILPVVFFSIFATIFGQSGGGSSNDLRALDVRVLDLDRTGLSKALTQSLAEQDALEISQALGEQGAALSRDELLALVRTGKADAAIVLPAGFEQNYGGFGGTASEVELIYDASNPMAQHTISGLLQASAMTASPTTLIGRGRDFMDGIGGGLTDEQREAFDSLLGDDSLLTTEPDEPETGADENEATTSASTASIQGLISVQALAAHDPNAGSQPSLVPYYAAGIGVMFLLFSLTAAAGSLLDEEDTGTLERLLVSRASMTEVLLSHWLFYSAIGIAQLIVMFLWGAFAFDLELFSTRRLVGFLLVTVATALAASAFALLLATLSRTRAQLNGMSTIVILIMSAVGGSMIPRFVMPRIMDDLALFTFNGWALDGFLKVFWYADPEATFGQALGALAPQLSMLALMCGVFLFLARRFARRWEAL